MTDSPPHEPGRPVSNTGLAELADLAAHILNETHPAAATALGDSPADALLPLVEQILAEKAAQQWVDEQVVQTGIRSMEYRNGAACMELEAARELLPYWVAACRSLLGDGPNYSETKIEMNVKVVESPETYTVVIQRHAPGALTPHEARQRAEARVTELEAELEATHAARLHDPVLRHCLHPHCTREFDINATMGGYEPERPTWSGKGWVQVKQLDGHMCPEHAPVVGNLVVPGPHLPRWQHAEHDAPSILRCPCGWDSPPVHWRRYATEAWKDHLLTAA